MRALRHLPLFLVLVTLIGACSEDDSPSIETPELSPQETLAQLVMDGTTQWRVASVTSSPARDFDGVITNDWFAQMDSCLKDDPFTFLYEAYADNIGDSINDEDFFTVELFAGRNLLCSEFEQETDHIARGDSEIDLQRFTFSPAGMHTKLYGVGVFTQDFTGPYYEETWDSLTYSYDSITYQVNKKFKDGNYQVYVKFVPF